MVQSLERTVILGLSLTEVTIAVSDPAPVSLDWIVISGSLKDLATGLPMSGAAVDILEDGSLQTTVTTDGNGAYSLEAQFEEGHYSLQARFTGDVGHASDYSPLVTVDAWRPTTSITIAVSPGSGAPPIDETISGILTRDDTGDGIAVPTKLFRDGVQIASKSSGINGAYSFIDSLPSPGVFVYYTKFDGNVKFQGCEEGIIPCSECRHPIDARGKEEVTCWFCGAVFETVIV